MDESPFGEIAHPQQRAFIGAFRQTGNVGLSARCCSTGNSRELRIMLGHELCAPDGQPLPGDSLIPSHRYRRSWHPSRGTVLLYVVPKAGA